VFGWINWDSYYSCPTVQRYTNKNIVSFYTDKLIFWRAVWKLWDTDGMTLRRKPTFWSLFPCTEIPDLVCHMQFNYLELKYAAWLTLQDVIQYKFCWSNSPIQPTLDLEWAVNYDFLSPSPSTHARPLTSANTSAFRCLQALAGPPHLFRACPFLSS
jgi:hypothetical protein